MAEMVTLGYHVVSDDSVNSAYLPRDAALERIKVMMEIEHYDVDHIWLRNDAGEVTWEWRESS